MERSELVDWLLAHINNIHELGGQCAFELDNPFYAKYEGDGDCYLKENCLQENYIWSASIAIFSVEFGILRDRIEKAEACCLYIYGMKSDSTR